MKTYIPNPRDASGQEVPEDLLELTETIAENVHELWAQARIREGWTYGEERSSEKKTTPLLVPYEDLPESEKEYDRTTAMGTLKLILSLGYHIEKK